MLIVFAGITQIYAQEQNQVSSTIPSWIKIIAGAWYNDDINDNDFSNALEWMIQNNVIVLDNSQLQQISMVESEKKLYELEIENKVNKIMALDNELKSISLDNTILLQKVTELEQKLEQKPKESKMIVNLHQQIQTLHDKLDKGEEAKDVMEERLLKDVSDLQQLYEPQLEKLRRGWSDSSTQYDLLKMKYDVLKESGVDLDKLNQLLSEKDRIINELQAELESLK